VRSAIASFRGDPSSIPGARHWVRATLASWGLDAARWTAAQVVSELATNCTLHARSPFTVRLAEDDGGVRLEIDDDSPVSLRALQYSATSTTGRGLFIVDSLATQWGVSPREGGKTVWALLPVADPVAGRPDDVSAAAFPRSVPAGSTPAAGVA